MAELQTILKDFKCTGAGGSPRCTCGPAPCIDGTFGSAYADSYWSATSNVPHPENAWDVDFGAGNVNSSLKLGGHYVRAVRGGL